jgi:kynurenine formamidase
MIRISHPLSKQSPLYKNTLPVSFHPIKSIDNGDSSNSSSVTFSNHSGTHIDAPLHFCKNTNSIADLLEPENLFYPTYCLDIPLTSQTPLIPELLKDTITGISDAQALLIQTGMSRQRDTDRYLLDYPWVDPKLPDFFRRYLPHLRLFGIDTLSVTNPAYREQGRLCHRNFLCKKPEIMILEDLDLSHDQLSGHPWLLRVFPWILEKLDAVPVVALLEEDTRENKNNT